MSRVVIRLVRWFATALLALSIVLLGSAESKADPKSDDTTDAKLKVVSKKGRTKGNYSVLSRKSKPGSENDGQWKGANRSENRIPNGDQESIAAWCWAQTEDTSCLVTGPSDVATLLTGPLARAMAVNLVVQLRFPAPKPILVRIRARTSGRCSRLVSRCGCGPRGRRRCPRRRARTVSRSG